MPAAKLSDEPSVVYPYDVLAQSAGATGLMLHALLCNEADARHDVTDETVLRGFHMGPPLGPHRAACDAYGTAGLTAKQRSKVKVFVNDRREERAAEKRRLRQGGRAWNAMAQYRIHPEATPPTRDYPLWRFNCVGVVTQAYISAGIELLTGPYPLKSVGDIKRLYPDAAGYLDDADQRKALGIGEGDRWPVVLVGYLLHSLSRPIGEINGPGAQPYCPREGDEFFSH